MSRKRKLEDYDDANGLAMVITDTILNAYDPIQNRDKIEIPLDESGYSFDLQDLIRDIIIKSFNVDEFYDKEGSNE
jgi:hypothetical protein|tara:strand:- start:807 stop:1034 length:228 start_codon:yes stop_codon:yes gene_type:complete